MRDDALGVNQLDLFQYRHIVTTRAVPYGLLTIYRDLLAAQSEVRVPSEKLPFTRALCSHDQGRR